MSLCVGIGYIVVTDVPWHPAFTLGYAVVLGVGIDFDHFVIARYNTGSWQAVRRCLAKPQLVLTAQHRIFADDAIFPVERLLSHLVVTPILVGGTAVVSSSLGVLAAIVLYTHITADVIADARHHEDYVVPRR